MAMVASGQEAVTYFVQKEKRMDQEKAQKYIDEALSEAEATMASQGISLSDLETRVDYAENYVLVHRSSACSDEELASAQHYFKMRHWVIVAGPVAVPVCMSFISGYYGVKKAGELLGFSDDLAIGSCPVSPASFWQVRWATQGVWDGLGDHYILYPAAHPPF